MYVQGVVFVSKEEIWRNLELIECSAYDSGTL